SVAFWSAAARLTPSPTRGEDGQFLTLLPAAGTSCVRMQAIDGGPRVHLDVASHDRDALLRRALGLGATEAWRYEDVPVLRCPRRVALLPHALRARATPGAPRRPRPRPGLPRHPTPAVGRGGGVLAAAQRSRHHDRARRPLRAAGRPRPRRWAPVPAAAARRGPSDRLRP